METLSFSRLKDDNATAMPSYARLTILAAHTLHPHLGVTLALPDP